MAITSVGRMNLGMQQTTAERYRSAGIARSLNAPELAEIASLGVRGDQLAQQDPRVAATRALMGDPTANPASIEGQQRAGYDIGVAAAMGTVSPTPEQDRLKENLRVGTTPNAVKGFELGQALAFGITKQSMVDEALGNVSQNATVASGQLVTNGLADSGLSAEQKASIMGDVVSNPLARQGAQAAIGEIAADQESSGFWSKVKAFFGF